MQHYLHTLVIITFALFTFLVIKPITMPSKVYTFLKSLGMLLIGLMICLNLLDIIQKINQPYQISEYTKLNILLKLILFFILILSELCIYKHL